MLVPVAIWIYTLVFAMSSLWFAHFCLAALHALRAQQAGKPVHAEDVVQEVPPTLSSNLTPENEPDRTPPQSF
jgi:hypothetical protein